MGRKKSPTLSMDVGARARTPLASRLSSLITEPVTIAKHLGVSSQAISQYRNGGAQPTLDRLCEIADYYGVSVDYLLGRTASPSTDMTARSACDYTGLSQGTVDNIRGMGNEKKLFDWLIQKSHFLDIMTYLSAIKTHAETVAECKQYLDIIGASELSDDERAVYQDKATRLTDAIQARDVAKLRVQETMFKVFAEVESGANLNG